MIRSLAIAFRNLFRNARRSATTVMAVATGGIAVLMLGGFITNIFNSLETGLIQGGGHLQIFRKGYFLFGAGDPSSYGIANYAEVIATLKADPDLSKVITVASPQLMLFGVAGNFSENVSRTFLGVGMVPSDRARMYQWNRYGLHMPNRATGLTDDQPDSGVVGVGLARVLHLCGPLQVPDCPTPPPKSVPSTTVDTDIESLAQGERKDETANAGTSPRIDLLAATAQGAPNVVSLSVLRAQSQGIKEMDDVFTALPLGLAQKLIYGKAPGQVTSIILQLDATEHMPETLLRLEHIYKDKGWDLETRTFHDLTPFYDQAISMFRSIFAFVAILMGVIVLFTVVNTMSMAVMERTEEIGTLRALGLRRQSIRALFVIEGLLLGMAGATIGVILAILFAAIINASHMTWLPPNNVERIPLAVDVIASPEVVVLVWVGLVVLATLSAVLPANRAARLPIVEALYHV